MIIFRILLFSLISVYAGTLFSQTNNWLHIENDESTANYVSQLSDENYLIANRVFNIPSPNQVSKVSSSGELLWSKNICDCTERFFVYTDEVANLNLIHVSANGKIYTTDADGNNPILVDQILPDSLIINAFAVFDIPELSNGVVHFTGQVNIADTPRVVRTMLDLQTLNITNSFSDFIKTPLSVAISNAGIRAELYRDDPEYFVNFLDSSLQLISTVVLSSSSSTRFVDISFDDFDQLYAVGFSSFNNGFPRMGDGAIALIDSSKTLTWTKSYPDPAGNNILTIQHINIEEDKILIGGSSGTGGSPVGLSDAYIAQIDTQGNLVWQTTFDVIGENDNVRWMGLADSSRTDELIVFGSGGLTDVSGPQRTYLASFNLNVSNSIETVAGKAPRFSPNPVSDILHIQAEHAFKSIEVIDPKGAKIGLLPAGTTTVDMSGYTTGIYFFKINFDGFSHTMKVVRK